MAFNYHMEALRKQRIIDRKNEAARLDKQDTNQSEFTPAKSSGTSKEAVLITDANQFEQQRSSVNYGQSSSCEEGVVFGEVIHDPNFKFRILKSAGNAPVHVDPIYKIMYPDSYRYDHVGSPMHLTTFATEQNCDSELAKKLRKGFDFSHIRKHISEKDSIPKTLSPCIASINRDHVYKILHPYEFFAK